MHIGVPKENKNHEYRVGLIPASVRELVLRHHTVWVESQAGFEIGFDDQAYRDAGAFIVPSAKDVFEKAKLIIKVKEPLAQERILLRQDHVLFTYLHLAPDPEQALDLLNSGACCIAYETVTDALGRLPLLAPMSEVAGRMSIQAGAQALERSRHGRGILLGGVPGVEPATVVIIGGGVVGSNAALMAVGLGARVIVLDTNIEVLRRLTTQFGSAITTVYSTQEALDDYLMKADLVIGGILIPGATAPKLVSASHIASMKPGAAVVDVAIDQGGCIETCKPTTHENPTFVIDGIVHYCVANMPGAVPYTSTVALTNATLQYAIQLAEFGWEKACRNNVALQKGLNIVQGQVVFEGVAAAFDLELTSISQLLY